jgi:hypothetical protein
MRIFAALAAIGLISLVVVPSTLGAFNIPIEWATTTADKKVLLVTPTVLHVTGTVTCTAPGSDMNGNGLVEADIGVLVDVTQGKGSGAVSGSIDVPGVDGGRCTDAVNRTTTWEIDVPTNYPDATATWRNGPVTIHTQAHGCAEGWALEPGDVTSCGSAPSVLTQGKVSKR